MKLIPKRYDDLPNQPDPSVTREYRSKVVVEWKKAWWKSGDKEPGRPVKVQYIKCYIPADAWKDRDGNVIIRYECHPTDKDGNVSYDPYFVYEKWDEHDMPNLYDKFSLDTASALLLALGILLGYDEEQGCMRPFLDYEDENGKDVYLKWKDIPQLKDNWRKWTDDGRDD